MIPSKTSSILPFSSSALLIVAITMGFAGTIIASATPTSASCDIMELEFNTFVAGQNCIQSIAFDKADALSTLDSLDRLVPLYVFLDTSKPFVDIEAGLSSIRNKVSSSAYTMDAEFQDDLASLFSQLHDAHTRYTKPRYPYQLISFVQPFFLSSVVNTTTQKHGIYLHVNGNLSTAYNDVYGADPFNGQQVDGFEVVSIDGVKAVDAIVNFANSSIGYCKDVNARFNLAVDGYGGAFYGRFAYRTQDLFSMPASTNITFVLSDPSGNTQSFTTFWMTRYNSSTPLTFEQRKLSQKMHELDEHRVLAGAAKGLSYKAMHEHLPKSSSQQTPGSNLNVGPLTYLSQGVVDPVSVAVFENDMGRVGVLRIGTWNPANRSDFINTIESGMQKLLLNPVVTVIIDLRLNGGGDICLAYAALRFLFPNISPTVGTYDMRYNDLFLAMANNGATAQCNSPNTVQLCGGDPEQVGYFTPCAWSSPLRGDNVDFVGFSDSKWFSEPITRSRGGVSDSKYSQLIQEGCAVAYTEWVPSCFNNEITPDGIIIVSDGLCGSSCAVFAKHIQQTHNAKTVAIGGIPGVPMSITSFPGGEVENVDFVIASAAKYGVGDPALVPQPFARNSSFRFAIREIYPFNTASTEVPLEFVFDEADFRLPYSSDLYVPGSDLLTFYNGLYKQIPLCASWAIMQNNVTNGICTRKCVDGSYDICKLSQCNPGYGPDVTGSYCTACEAGKYNDGSSLSCKPCTNGPDESYYTGSAQTSNNCPYECFTGYSGTLCSEAVSAVDGYTTGEIAGTAMGSFISGVIICLIAQLISQRTRRRGYTELQADLPNQSRIASPNQSPKGSRRPSV